MIFQPYPRRRRAYVRHIAWLYRSGALTRIEFANCLRAVMGALRED